MLQGLIWVRGTGKAGEWEALTQGTQGKKTNFCHSKPAASISPVFDQNKEYNKIEMGPIGGLVEFWCKFV